MKPKTQRELLVSMTALAALLVTVSLVAAKVTNEATAPVRTEVLADKSEVQGLVFAIRSTGFVPAEVELPAGTYLFIVQNRSGIRDLSFRLDREAGDKLHEVRDQKLQWKKQFDLHPGKYILTVVDHPKWRSTITVKSN